MGFEIFLEGQGFVFVRESAVPDELPRSEFGCVRRSARVVLGNAALQILRRADVFLLWKFDAADDVDVPHRVQALAVRIDLCYQPVFALRATPGTTLRPSGNSWLRHA